MHDDGGPDVYVPPELLSGVWANRVRMDATTHEFTLDFIRMSPFDDAEFDGALVARVSFSAALMIDLIDLLQKTFADYAGNSLPKEVRGDDEVRGES